MAAGLNGKFEVEMNQGVLRINSHLLGIYYVSSTVLRNFHELLYSWQPVRQLPL